MATTTEPAALLALLARTSLPWHQVAALAEAAGGAGRLLDGDLSLVPGYDQPLAKQLAATADPKLSTSFTKLLDGLDPVRDGRLLTSLDPGYPDELRLQPDRPPLLFTRGQSLPADGRLVTILASPTADPDAHAWAEHAAVELTTAQIAVASNAQTPLGRRVLTATLEAGGQVVALHDRPLADQGPPVVAELLDRLAHTPRGTLVSPCWPAGWPMPTHPVPVAGLYQAVCSGLGVGVLAVAGQPGDGVQAQVEQCLRTGRHVLVWCGLREPWITSYTEDPIVKIVETAGTVVEVVDAVTYIPPYLSVDVG